MKQAILFILATVLILACNRLIDDSLINAQDEQALIEGVDVGVFPHWQLADEQLGKEARNTNKWCMIASGTYEEPVPTYSLDVISTNGLSTITKVEGDSTIQDVIPLDSVKSWIYKHDDLLCD